MQGGVGVWHQPGVVCVGIEFVGHVNVVQLRLPDKRRRFGADTRRGARRGDEQFLNLPPRNVITQRHGCVQDNAACPGQRRVVDDGAVEYLGVGNRDNFLPDGFQTGDEKGFSTTSPVVVPI